MSCSVSSAVSVPFCSSYYDYGKATCAHSDSRLAVPSQRGLEEIGELGVAVGDMALLVCQRHDDIAERRQRLVDVLGFFQPLSRRP